MAGRIRDFFGGQVGAACRAIFPELTERERQVLDLIAKGEANPVIARHLSISEKTVRNNVSNIFSKLQVADRARAIVRARQAGMGWSHVSRDIVGRLPHAVGTAGPPR